MQKKQKQQTFNAQQFADAVSKNLKVIQQQREHRDSAEFKKVVTFCKLMTQTKFYNWMDTLTQQQKDELWPTFDHYLDCVPNN